MGLLARTDATCVNRALIMSTTAQSPSNGNNSSPEIPAELLDDWIPWGIDNRWDPPVVQWYRRDQADFGLPFFNQTAKRALADVDARDQHYTSIKDLIEIAETIDFTPPRGFIFHLSRCGSTLLSQMLAAAPHNLVFSEPGPLGQVLLQALQNKSDHQSHVRWFRAMLKVMARVGDTNHQACFVKFTDWAILNLALVREAFPDVPCVFLFRHPLEVVASLTKGESGTVKEFSSEDRRGLVSIYSGTAATQATALEKEEYIARCLANFSKHALASREHLLMVDYTELPDAFFSRILPHFGLHPDNATLAAMRTASTRYSKDPEKLRGFENDGAAKLAGISQLQRHHHDNLLKQPHAALVQAATQQINND